MWPITQRGAPGLACLEAGFGRSRQLELVQVIVFPAEEDLKDRMQIRQSRAGRHQHPAPDWRTGAGDTHLELVNVVGRCLCGFLGRFCRGLGWLLAARGRLSRHRGLSLHPSSARIRRTEVRAMPSRCAISAGRSPCSVICRTCSALLAAVRGRPHTLPLALA